MGRIVIVPDPMDVEDVTTSFMNGFLFSEELSGDPADCPQRTT